MQIRQVKNKYEIEFPYNAAVVADIKKVMPKAYYNNVCWIAPITCKKEIEWLVGKYGAMFAAAQAPEQILAIPPMPELSAEHKEILRTELLRQCYHYQEQGVAYNLAKKRVINGDDMGAGKTQVSVATIVAAGLKNKCGLVICKSSLKYTWEREFKAVAGMKSIILTDAVKSTWYRYYTMMGVSVFITNYESLEKYFAQQIIEVKNKAISPEDVVWKKHPLLNKDFKDLFDWVIVDEGHEIRNEATVKSAVTIGIGRGKEYRLLLTGTPIVNKASDIYPQLNFLGMTKNTREDKKAWMDRYFLNNKATNTKELHSRLSLHCYFRRNKAEFGIDLPELTMQMMYSDITNRKEYERCEKNLATYLKEVKGKTEGQIEKSMNGEIMVQIQQLMNISARGKMRDACDAIDEVLNAGEKVVVGINQKDIKEGLIKHYHALKDKGRLFVISGEENAAQKNAAEQGFKELQGHGLIIVSIKAGGVGINLQTASNIICLELPWHPAIFYQFIARVHRNGQKNKTFAKVIIGQNTFDNRIWEIIESKKEIADQIAGSDDSDVQREIINKVRESLFKK